MIKDCIKIFIISVFLIAILCLLNNLPIFLDPSNDIWQICYFIIVIFIYSVTYTFFQYYVFKENININIILRIILSFVGLNAIFMVMGYLESYIYKSGSFLYYYKSVGNTTIYAFVLDLVSICYIILKYDFLSIVKIYANFTQKIRKRNSQ